MRIFTFSARSFVESADYAFAELSFANVVIGDEIQELGEGIGGESDCGHPRETRRRLPSPKAATRQWSCKFYQV